MTTPETNPAPSADPVYDMDLWRVLEWQKIQPEEGVYRYYRLTLQQNLWGEWELVKSWGRIGQRPTRVVRQSISSPDMAVAIAADVDKQRRQRGYLYCIKP